MTATIDAPAKRGGKAVKAKGGSGFVPMQPQVNLLPPEVRASRVLGTVKRWLAVVVVLAVLGSGAMFALSMLAQGAADDELALQKAETERLVAEQQQYAEVPLVLHEIQRLEVARETGMEREVLWRPYLSAIAATAPADVSVETVSVALTPLEQLGVASLNPLASVPAGTITFSGDARTLPDTAAWLDGLASIPGLKNAWFSTATITEVDGVVSYTVTGTVDIDPSAQAGRFRTEVEN